MFSKPTNAFARSFKEADIRGIYPTEIDEAVAYATGFAFIDEFSYKKIVVGYDMRLSTPSLVKAFIQGATDAGGDIVNIGAVHSPLLYFVSGTLHLPGAMITASHSPKEYNGIKLVAAGAVPLTKATGLGQIKKRVAAGNMQPKKKLGKVTKANYKRDYMNSVLAHVDRKHLAGIKLAADVGNGMASVFIDELDRRLPAEFDEFFDTPDGRFPHHDSDPCLSENQKQLKKKLLSKKYDFGIGFDGDADRIAFLDEKGEYVNAAIIGALVAKHLLHKQPGSAIAFTNLCSRVFKETILAEGGKPVRTKVGHTFVKEGMRKHQAIFGAEHSGHFFFKDFFYTDSVVLTLFNVMEVYAKAKASGQTFSELVAPYRVYTQTEDVVIPVANKALALKKIEAKLESMKPKAIKKFDGYFVDFGDVWGAIKPSVTEYAIKLMFESKNKSKAAKLQKELATFVKSIANETK